MVGDVASTSRAVELPSKSQLRKCGKRLKEHYYSNSAGEQVRMPPEDHDEAMQVLRAFRAAHSSPMLGVRMGVTSFAATTGTQQYITQRLKRAPRIIRKLHRMPRCPLPELEDIGGVRAILADGPELDRLRSHLERKWSKAFLRDPRDYIASPKAIGYRAVHFVVEREGRAIEVQLRTVGQQQWADAVEAADTRLGLTLKDGDGPAEMVEWFAVAGEVIYHREYRLPLTLATLARLEEARVRVVRAGYFAQ